MNSGNRVLCLALLAVAAMSSVSFGQTNYFFRPVTLPVGASPLPAPPGLNGNWYTEEDGDPNTSGGANWYTADGLQNFIPAFDFGLGERAFIENGGTAIVNSLGPYQPGQIVMGSAGGTSGTLEIQSGGTITSKIGGGVNGNINVGSTGGTGTLRVLPGGTITAEGQLVQGNNSANLIRIGGAGVGTATVTAATANLASRVEVFPNAAVTINGSTNLAATTIYAPQITQNGVNGKLEVGTTATLNGQLNLSFVGYNPSLGHNWNVLEAGSIIGNFTSITTNATLASNQAFVITKPAAGSQTAYNVSVQEVLVLEVNRDNGEARLRHPGSAAIQLDGYFIGSDAGSLKPGSWNNWDTPNLFGGDWLATDARADNLGELKIAGNHTFNGGNTLNYNFGSIFDPYAGPFGTVSEDLEFSYRRSDGTQFPGKVIYSGTKFNTLLLQVDPTGTGDAFLKNTSDTTVEIDAYDIRSAAGRLAPGAAASLDGAANAWISVSSSANLLGEVNQSGWTTLAPGASFNLGKLYLGGAQDLQLAFLLKGQENATPGHVLYQAATGGVPGDYNENGIVDAADYTLWRNNFNGSSTALKNRNPLNSGNINQADYTFWKQRFGSTSGSGSISAHVPEPATCWLLVVALGLVAASRGQR